MLHQRFADAPEWKLAQAWRTEPEPAFRPGTVRIGWRGDRFLYLVEFEDDDIFTQARERNQPLWSLGDVCEVFAAEAGSPRYIEYHTAPNGMILQLAYPHAQASKNWAAHRILDEDAIHFTRAVEGGWEVYGEISGRSVTGREGSLRGQVWEISVSRYDYDSKGSPPVLSSTSHHTQASYHRRHEWRRVRFE